MKYLLRYLVILVLRHLGMICRDRKILQANLFTFIIITNDCTCQDSGAFSTLSCLGGILKQANIFYKNLLPSLSLSGTHLQVANLSQEGNSLGLFCYSSKVGH